MHKRFLSEDPLADDTLLQKELSKENGTVYQDLYFLFKSALYDWSRFDPKMYGYNVIHLGGSYGYFTIVDNRDYKRLSRHKWKPRVIYARDVNGERNGRVVRVDACRGVHENGKSFTIYMHREVTAAGPGIDVDHTGGVALDNRRCRLRCTTRTQNNHNWIHRERPVHKNLKRGVEWGDPHHKTVRGIIWWTVRGRRKCKRSKRMSYTPEHVEKAYAWYLAERNKLHGHKKWAVGGKLVKSIVFPPRTKYDIPF